MRDRQIKPLRPECGFTLIEVLIALLIIALVGVSVQQRLGQFLDAQAQLRDRQEAHWVAWNQVMSAYQQAFWGDQSLETPRSDTPITMLGRHWYASRARQGTVVGELYRLQLSVSAQPPGVVAEQPSEASLAIYLVAE